jgi:ligand-binding sensor domain-containing protein
VGDVLQRVNGKGLVDSGSVYSIAVNEDGRIALIQDNRILVMNSDSDIHIVAETEDAVAGWAINWGSGESLWVGCSNGLREYDIGKKSLVRQVTALMSLDDWEFTTSRSLLRDESNKFFCGTNGGLVIVDPVELAAFNAVPVVQLENVQWSNAQVVTDKNRHTVEYGKWTVEIEVRAAWFVDEKDVRYTFRLRGFDENWSELKSLANVRYNSLPVGNYVLESQAFTSLNGFGPKAELLRLKVTGNKAPGWSNPLTKIFSGK